MIEMQFYQQRLVNIFLAVKLFVFVTAFIIALTVVPYDPSIGLILFPKSNPPIGLVDFWVKRLLRPFASWDGAYFLTISLKGYIYEQEHAFFPLYPLMARIMAVTVFQPFSTVLSLTSRCLISAVAVSNVCHYISVRILYSISCDLFGDPYYAFLSAFFMILVPMQAVMSAVYSESLFTCLALVGLYYFYRRQREAAALAWCLAGATRSNGIFLPGFFLYDLIHAVRHLTPIGAIIRTIRTLILVAISWVGFLSVLAYGQTLYCTVTNPRPWCSSPFPNIYAFVQDHYWNVGFLRYFEAKQVPNFMLAAPTILTSLAAIYTYCHPNWIWALSAGLLPREPLLRKRPFFNRAVLPHILLLAVMLTYSVLVIHVQVINRLFMFMPVLCWFHAHLYYMAGGHPQGDLYRYNQLFLLGTFSVITTVLFFSFYPPA